MISEEIFGANCNYVEFSILPFQVSNANANANAHKVYETNFEKDEFYKVMKRLSHDESLKYFQKEYKQYVSQDLIYENKDNDDICVYKKKMVDEGLITDNCIYTTYQKTKLSILAFPSSIKIHSISYIRKLTFRVNNRIYVNFECKYENDEIFYRIYINYNHEQNVELDKIKLTLNKYIKMLYVNF